MFTPIQLASRKRNSQKGQSLIEVMVVVVIIAVIAGTIALNYAHARSNATVSVTQANMKEIAAALEVYNQDNQQYPASGTVNSTLFGANAVKYLPSTPNAPGNGGGAYIYTLDAAGDGYTIEDPDTYESASLAALPKGTAPAAGVEAAPGAKCGATGTCTRIGYASAGNLFAW